MSKYKQYFNAACEQRYKLSRYRRELAVVEELRAVEELKRVEIANESLASKTKNVRGFKEREAHRAALRTAREMIVVEQGSVEDRPWSASVFKDL
jgi:hypothetical protein